MFNSFDTFDAFEKMLSLLIGKTTAEEALPNLKTAKEARELLEEKIYNDWKAEINFGIRTAIDIRRNYWSFNGWMPDKLINELMQLGYRVEKKEEDGEKETYIYW